jgi:hypothetical protein
MFKKIVSTLASAVFAFFATSAMAQQPVEKTQVKPWEKQVKSEKKAKKTRAVTPDGKPVLVDESGARYLLTDDGKRFMVDQDGNKVRVDELGKIILLPDQKEIPKRFGPGPVA